MSKSLTTEDGVKLSTSSTRRFVVFTVHDGKPSIFKRTDNVDKAWSLFSDARRWHRHVVLVDFGRLVSHGVTAQIEVVPSILRDSRPGDGR